MEQDDERRRGFQVKDRRRFSETGEVRSEAVDEPVAPEPAQKAEAPPPSDTPAADEPVTFSTFVLGLSTQALLHLGEIPNPVNRAIERDLVAAKQVIDILGVLREKTRNNLESAEETLLDSMLYDLRMRYVQLVRGGSKEGT